MDRRQALLAHLPALYRPQPEDDGLLARLVASCGGAFAEVEQSVGEVLPTRWLERADAARFAEHFVRGRQLAGLAPADPADPEVAGQLDRYPHVRHLARLAALLDLPPWREPAALRESVEDYRRRLRRIVALYRGGLGTVAALRRMVEAQLPATADAPPALRDAPFWIEEHAPLVAVASSARSAGPPADLVGPLMRFRLHNEALEATPVAAYVTGLEPRAGSIDPAARPLLELFEGPAAVPVGLGFRGTLAPGETLRLRPAHSSWLLTAGGVLGADRDPAGEADADPTAPGPWSAVAGAPAGEARALLQSHDRALWLAVERQGAGELWRFDGAAWALAAGDLPSPSCLVERGPEVLVGTADGLHRVPLYPDGAFAASPVDGLAGPVHAAAIASGPAGGEALWLGTEAGVAVLAEGGPPAPFVLGAGGRFSTPVRALAADRGGRIFLGGELGLFRFEPASGEWHWYSGEEPADRAADWRRFDPRAAGDAADFPDAEEVFLPPVGAVLRGGDGALWLGTAEGLARYTAHEVDRGAFTTRLEAFPELGVGPVHALALDPRGLLWIAGSRGLFRFDGRDFWQHAEDAWVRLGNLDAASPDGDRGSWRFSRPEGAWQRFDAGGERWLTPAPPPVGADRPAVRGMAWSDRVIADLGALDETSGAFEPDRAVAPEELVVRVKPTPERLLDGGVPALPRLPPGSTTWRYLSLEEEGEAPPEERHRPAWSREGRLWPPPDAPAAPPARFDLAASPAGAFDDSAFAFCPAAAVRFVWRPRRPHAAVVRLARRTPGEPFDPAVLDRVWQGMQQVRPAGARLRLAVDQEVLRGD